MNPNVTPKLLLSVATVAATASSAAIELPNAPSYLFLMDVGAATGTSPTMDMAIQVTFDEVTYYTVARFTQATTTSSFYNMIRNGLAIGEAAFSQTIADTGGAQTKNVVFTRKIRLTYTVGGTNPSFATIKVWVAPQPYLDW